MKEKKKTSQTNSFTSKLMNTKKNIELYRKRSQNFKTYFYKTFLRWLCSSKKSNKKFDAFLETPNNRSFCSNLVILNLKCKK